MNNHQLLSYETHGNCRVITDRSYTLGDGIMHAMIFATELRASQAHYPIFFCKDNETGTFYPAALFGFEQGENLYLENNTWSASYVPMIVERHPFLIGFKSQDGAADANRAPVVSIDMDSPRVSRENGRRLFNDDGQPSEFLGQSVQLLDAVHRGHSDNKGFIEVLLRYDLLESCTMDIGLVDGTQRKLLGYYTINESKLRELSGDILTLLHAGNYLERIYMVVASLSNMGTLIEKKNTRLQPDRH